MNITRRTLLQGAMAGIAGGTLFEQLASAQVAKGKIRIGSCQLDLPKAKSAGLAGVEISAGGAADKLRVADPAVRQKYKDQMRETGLVISSFMLGLLNSYPFASDPRAPAWLEQSIDAAADLRAKVLLVAFFGKGDLRDKGQLKNADVDAAVSRLRAAAPRARDAGVILAIENTLSARQNAEILDRVGQDSVRIYYDVGNSTRNGYDVPEEIRFLKDRIAMMHFKDGPNYLGEGAIQFPPIASAVEAIGYQGWIVLETSNPSKDAVADARRNAAFIRKLFRAT